MGDTTALPPYYEPRAVHLGREETDPYHYTSTIQSL